MHTGSDGCPGLSEAGPSGSDRGPGGSEGGPRGLKKVENRNTHVNVHRKKTSETSQLLHGSSLRSFFINRNNIIAYL